MKRFRTALALLVLACGTKPTHPPDLVERELPGNQVIMPTVLPFITDPDLHDAGPNFVDGGLLCCPVQFALAATDESMAQVVFSSETFAMSRSNGIWTTTACVAPTTTVYFYQVGYPTDDDAGILWINRVNDAVPVSNVSTIAPEVNLFIGADAGTCQDLSTGIYGTVPDAGSTVSGR